jgi:hypothetical protein
MVGGLNSRKISTNYKNVNGYKKRLYNQIRKTGKPNTRIEKEFCQKMLYKKFCIRENPRAELRESKWRWA